MSLIKIHVITQEINKKIEILTHDLLRIYSLDDSKTNSILLPCPLDKIQILIDSTCFQFELKDNLKIEIQHCTKCNNITTKKKCLCFVSVSILKINLTYISNGNISCCSKEILDILLRIIQYTYISTIKSMNDRSKYITLNNTEKYTELGNNLEKHFNLRDVSHYWVIDKQFRNYKSCSRAWYHIVNFSRHIRDSIYNFKIDILSVFGLGFKFFRKIKNETKKITTSQNQETKPNILNDYLSYIYKYIGIILNYSNEEILDMIRVILGLSFEMVNQKNIFRRGKNLFEIYVYKKKISTNFKKSYNDLITINDVKKDVTIQVSKNTDNTQIPNLYDEKLKIINFICSLHKEIKSKQNSTQFKDLRSHFNNGLHRRTKIEIEGESLFSSEKLIALYLDNVKIHRSQNKPLQLTFEDDKNNLHNYLYKENSDLSVDLFFNSLTEYIYEIVECHYKLYNLLLISKQSGIIEMKQGRLISTFESIDQLKKYLILCEEDYTSLTAFDQFKSFSKSRIDNFLKSLAISLLICYLFEIRDRTPNNILIDNEGRVFNIDYEYTLGTSPFFLNPDIEIPSLISQLLKSDTLILNKFYYLLCNYYKVIRENYLKILMMGKILTSNKPTYFNQKKFERIFFSKLHLEKERSIAEEMMMESFKKSLGSYKTKIREFLTCVKREITS